MKIRPIILSGGSGSRLWPVSRAKVPKQFVPLLTEDTLFATTLQTVADTNVYAPPLIVGNEEHKFMIHDALETAKVAEATVLLEPTGRNTAIAALVAALAEKDEDILHLVRPSDQVIANTKAWSAALSQAIPAAASNFIVLFGVQPDYPETGYGYILSGASTGFDSVSSIKAFKEKPDTEKAQAFIAEGALWNSGIFLYSPQTLIAEARKLAPALLQQAQQALDKAQKDPRGLILDAKTYIGVVSEPFDRVFMEQTTLGAVVPCSMGWNDLGSWQSLWQASAKDAEGNANSGLAVTLDTRNSYIHTEGPTVAVLGMDDVAVIVTKDAVLVTPLARTQDVKSMLAAVEKTNPDLAQNHPRARRPWGSYETVASGSQFQVKHITVLPGRSLSLQMHHHRAEHWVVVAGTAKIECDDVEKLIFPNESVYIPKGAKHRLTNPGLVDLHLIEVQSGDYLGEDDIIRFADNYGRQNPLSSVK